MTSSSSGYFEDEPPLLEELGINTRQIWRKTVSILNPIRSDPSLHEDGDLSGPFMFLLSFGLFQLLAGKFYFGIVLGKNILLLDLNSIVLSDVRFMVISVVRLSDVIQVKTELIKE